MIFIKIFVFFENCLTWSKLQVVFFYWRLKMTIKEVSEKFNISQDTLRFYEKEGLIQNVPRKNGIRNYGQKEIDSISFVICMRSAGLSIEVLREYLTLCKQGDSTIEQRKALLIKQREILKSKIDDMQNAYEKLNYKIDVYYSTMIEKERKFLTAD